MYSSINKIQDLIFQLQAGAQEEITVVQSHPSPCFFRVDVTHCMIKIHNIQLNRCQEENETTKECSPWRKKKHLMLAIYTQATTYMNKHEWLQIQVSGYVSINRIPDNFARLNLAGNHNFVIWKSINWLEHH